MSALGGKLPLADEGTPLPVCPEVPLLFFAGYVADVAMFRSTVSIDEPYLALLTMHPLT